MNTLEDFWRGPFGDAYTARNRIAWRKRIPFWENIIEQTQARSIYEVGTNAGWNLSAIQETLHRVTVAGCEINPIAADQARRCGLNIDISDFRHRCYENAFELVFTAGVLIHIPPAGLQEFMKAIVQASCDYVLAIEYEATEEQEVEYRGEKGKLWKRPYGPLYHKFGLNYIDSGILTEIDGFDNCAYWLFRK